MDIELPAATTEELGSVNRYMLSGDLLAGWITMITKPDLTIEVEKSYYHLDHLNSTKCVTDETGVLVVMYEYRAFGEQLKRLDADGDDTDDSAKYSYGGKELDDGTNLYYFNARYYDATIGRFINVDLVQDGSNWYVYCRNNSLKNLDKTGLRSGSTFDEATGDAYKVDSDKLESTVLNEASARPNYVNENGKKVTTCRLTLSAIFNDLGFKSSYIYKSWSGMNDYLNTASQKTRGNREIINLGKGEGTLAQKYANEGSLVIGIRTSKAQVHVAVILPDTNRSDTESKNNPRCGGGGLDSIQNVKENILSDVNYHFNSRGNDVVYYVIRTLKD